MDLGHSTSALPAPVLYDTLEIAWTLCRSITIVTGEAFVQPTVDGRSQIGFQSVNMPSVS